MILVTGGTGLLGSHLLYHLALANNKVRSLTRNAKNIAQTKETFGYYSSESEKLFQQIEWIEGDLLDKSSIYEALEGVDEVYHCAAFVSFDPKDRKRLINNNLISTENLVNACLENGIEKFCHVSSVAALGNPNEEGIINETSFLKHLKGKSGYAISKFKSELEVWRGTTEGLNAVIVNPSVLIGPGNWESGSGQLFSTIYKGLKFYSDGVTGYVDVNDVCKIMMQLMQENRFGERYVINTEDISYKKAFTIIAKNLNVKPPTIKLKKKIALLGCYAAKIISFITHSRTKITKEAINAAFNKHYFSNTKIVNLLQYSFNSIESAIEFTANCFLREK